MGRGALECSCVQVLNAKDEQLAFAFQVGYTRSAWSPLQLARLAVLASGREVCPAARPPAQPVDMTVLTDPHFWVPCYIAYCKKGRLAQGCLTLPQMRSTVLGLHSPQCSAGHSPNWGHLQPDWADHPFLCHHQPAGSLSQVLDALQQLCPLQGHGTRAKPCSWLCRWPGIVFVSGVALVVLTALRALSLTVLFTRCVGACRSRQSSSA